MSEVIKVKIGAREYSLQGESSDNLQTAAKIVDEKIIDINGGSAPETNDADTLLIAALNIAEEYALIGRERDKMLTDTIASIEEATNILNIACAKASSL